MSSPIRRTNSRSSPSRRTPNGLRHSHSQANGYHSPSSLRNNMDSPSRLIDELSKVYIDDEKAFRKKLDEAADEQERLHRQALAKSLKEHEEIRQSAERARERLQLEIERMKAQKAEEERVALERERQKTAEAEAAAKQRELEAVKKREEALQQAAQKQREVEEAQRRIEAQRKQETEDKAKREAEAEARSKEEAERKAREEAAAKERVAKEGAARKAAQPTPTVQPQQPAASQTQMNGASAAQTPAPAQASGAKVSGTTSNGVLVPQGISTPMQEREAEHKRYLDLHKQLKVMRKEISKQASDLGLKQLGDMRREIVKIMGQMNKVDKVANRQAMAKVKQIFMQAAQMQQIMVDITPYIVSVPPGKLTEAGGSTQYPGVLLFLLAHFAKAIVSQFAQEVSRDTLMADPIGIIAVTIFTAPEFRFNGHSLIDVLWAKYHKVCPVLFGIYGSEKTGAGRQRLGWRVEGEFVTPQEHYDRNTGFAAGFSAITLRDFTKSKNKSPSPVHLFWTSLARLLSTPNNEQTPTHYIVLNNMLKHSIPRFIGFYGTAAIAALRTACIIFPSGGGPPNPSGTGSDSTVLAVQSLPHSWQKDLNLTL